MPSKIKNLQIIEVSAVDRAANEGCSVLVMKRSEQEAHMSELETLQKLYAQNEAVKKVLAAASPEDKKKIIAAWHENDQARLGITKRSPKVEYDNAEGVSPRVSYDSGGNGRD